MAYFDGLAASWDSNGEADRATRLEAGLGELRVQKGERVLDLGCGTGALAFLLLKRVQPDGFVLAIDYSLAMLARARQKGSSPRVWWVVARGEALPLRAGAVDRAVLLALWPHLEDKNRTLGELRRVLSHGGNVHVWHLAPPAEVNRCHRQAGSPVARDTLEPARVLSQRLHRAGFRVTQVQETPWFLVSARKDVEVSCERRFL